MKKLIMSNFENILVNDDEEIPASTVVLFDELRRENVKIVVSTRDSLDKVLYYNHDFTFIDYIISADGSFIYDTILEKVIYKKNLLSSNVKKIVNSFYGECSICLIDNINYNLICGSDTDLNDYDIVKVDDYISFLDKNKGNIYKIVLFLKDKEEFNRALKKIGDLNLKVSLNIRKENSIYVIDVIHEDVNYINSLNKVLSKNKVDLDDVIYFGNDINILKSVGLGITTKSEEPYIKKCATDLIDDCDHYGIENYLKKYFNK